MITVLLLSLALQDTVVTAPKPERKICRDIESTGSRMGGTRECRTRAEWRAKDVPLDAHTVNQSMNTDGVNAGPEVHTMSMGGSPGA